MVMEKHEQYRPNADTWHAMYELWMATFTNPVSTTILVDKAHRGSTQYLLGKGGYDAVN